MSSHPGIVAVRAMATKWAEELVTHSNTDECECIHEKITAVCLAFNSRLPLLQTSLQFMASGVVDKVLIRKEMVSVDDYSR